MWKDNPGRRFYEKLGGVANGGFTTWAFNWKKMDAVVYEWVDLSAVVNGVQVV